MTPYYYRGENDRMSFCGLSLLRTGPESMTVVLTELPGNPGTPVSGIFDKLATHLFESRIVYLRVPPEQIVWIEYLPADGSADARSPREACCQVVLEWDGKRYHSPKRVPVSPDMLEEILQSGR